MVSLDALPEEFAVFPLGGALLLPGGKLPLNIFEPRYKAMVEDTLGAGRYFGMVQPDKRLARGDNGPGLYRMGCLGRISSFNESGEDRYLIALTGLIRFSIVEEIEMQRGYRRVRAAFSGFSADLRAAQTELPYPREDLLDSLQRFFAACGVEADWEAIGQMGDGELVTSLCMACPFSGDEKQALLEAKDSIERARALRALLEMGAFDSGAPDGGRPA